MFFLQDCEVSEETMGILGQQVASLKKELCASEGQLDRFRTELLQKDEQLEKRNNELTELAKQVGRLTNICIRIVDTNYIHGLKRLWDIFLGWGGGCF